MSTLFDRLRLALEMDASREHERTRHGWRCPACEKPMVERKNRRTGGPFFGCTAYPECEGTRDTYGNETGDDAWHRAGADPRDGESYDDWLTPHDFGYDGDG